MRTELEVLNKLCTIEQQTNMYLKHYYKYTQLIKKADKCCSDIYTDRSFKLKQKRKRIETYLTMLVGMKSELLWVFQRP